ncbi:MFS transporter [Streptomyces avermitilis]|uniref:MFS transporter n=1 Tax=Streptomyces avermitilis TaxID=33903 RepID=UPI0033AB831A
MPIVDAATDPADRLAAPGTLYRDVVRLPYSKRLLAGTLIGRLPNGMAPLAILMTSAPGYGTASGAALAALYLLASAAGGPLISRRVDRYGQTLAFSVSAVVSSAGLVLMAAGPRQLSCSVVSVVIAGATKPPLEAGLRTLWGTGPGSLMPTRDHQRTALALDAASQEAIYVIGPLLVAGIGMGASGSAALLATALLGAIGTALVVTTPPSRSWAAVPCRVDWLGPLRSSRLRSLYLAMVGIGVPIGALTPRAVDAAAQFGEPGLSGALPAVLSIGAVVGGLVYGSRTWPGTPVRQLIVLSSAFALGWLPMTLADSPTTALAAMAAPGLVMAPMLSAAFVVTGVLAPRGTITEAHALLAAALDVGCAAGAGSMELISTAALLPAGAAGGSLILIAARRHLIEPHRRLPVPVP